MEIPSGLIENLLKAKFVAVLTGAGVSAESGVKTFRDKDGLWTKFNPAELASPEGFLSNPALVLEWYRHRRELMSGVQPNPGHYALAKMEELFPKMALITQNIDRLHHKAGSKNVVELHGNIIDNHCNDCGKPFLGETALPDGRLAVCPECSGLIRPSVVWFGEMLPERAIAEAQKASMECDIFFSVGTSAEVYPAAGLPFLALRSGACFVEINPNRTPITNYADYYLQGPSGEILPRLTELLKKKLNN